MKKIALVIVLLMGLQPGARAGFLEGANAYKARNFALALKEISPLARAGNADAQHLLGLMYYMGQGVARDFTQAFNWHSKAAAQGKADAQYVVGAMYYTGNAVTQDQPQAAQWFRKAASQGHADAQHALGLLYRHGTAGLPQDNVLAYMLFHLAASSGHRNAPEQRAAVVRRMSGEQVEEAQSLSRSWRAGTPLPTRSRTGGEP